jgi:hypothetical protein
MSYKWLVWTVAIIPTAVLFVILRDYPQMLIGREGLNPSIILSLAGVVLSYNGLIFSIYAALQVQAISSVYFFKIRSPELHNKLRKISKSVSEFGTEPSDKLRSQTFFSEAPVAFRSAKRIKNKHVKKVAMQAERSLKALNSSMKLESGIPNYWEFHQKVSELVDELSEQLKDARAHS